MLQPQELFPQMTPIAQRQETPPKNSIELIEYLARSCTSCDLAKSRTNAVPGEGPTDARVMLIGEAPGQNEDKQGRPFIGAAGRLLDQLLPEAGLDRSEVYITNILKCRPPGNRNPLPEEISACRRHLDAQIAQLNPDLIITLGAFSLQHFIPGETIGSAAGQLRNINGRNIYPVMHPAAALRRGEFKERLIAHFQALPAALEQARNSPPTPEAPSAPKTPAPTQATFFSPPITPARPTDRHPAETAGRPNGPSPPPGRRQLLHPHGIRHRAPVLPELETETDRDRQRRLSPRLAATPHHPQHLTHSIPHKGPPNP